MASEHQALLEWARTIYWGEEPPEPLASADLDLGQLKATLPTWNRQAAIATLRHWLNEPPQSGVREQL